MKTAAKVFVVLILAFGTVGIFASPDAPLSALDRELFPGAGIGLVAIAWLVLLRVLFGGKKSEE
ncbi:MAG: hypothetical protein OEY14_16580 [Myxococcales bacterium]|nr:hypothetical protein [Myxococcales bacterium]